VALAIVEEVND